MISLKQYKICLSLYCCVLIRCMIQYYNRITESTIKFITKIAHIMILSRIGIPIYRLSTSTSTTLQILQRNKSQLQSNPKTASPLLKIHNIPKLSPQSRANLMKYNSVLIEYLQSSNIDISNSFTELDVFKNKLLPNLVLANGTEYQEYTMPKIINICLNHLQKQQQNI